MKNHETAHKELRRNFRNDILTLLQSGVCLEKLASESRVGTKELSQFVLPDTPENEWVPKFELDPRAFCRVNNNTKRMIKDLPSKTSCSQ